MVGVNFRCTITNLSLYSSEIFILFLQSVMGLVNRFLGGKGADFQMHPKPGCIPLTDMSNKYKFRGQSLGFAALAT